MKKRNPITELLSKPDIGASEPTGPRGVLAALFRRILSNIGMNGMRWSQLMNDFLRDPQNGIPDNSRDQTSARGNLMKEFAKDTMTFLVFIKGLRFLQPLDVEFIVRIRWKNKKVTEHSTVLDLSSPDVGYSFGEDEENDGEQPSDRDQPQ